VIHQTMIWMPMRPTVIHPLNAIPTIRKPALTNRPAADSLLAMSLSAVALDVRPPHNERRSLDIEAWR